MTTNPAIPGNVGSYIMCTPIKPLFRARARSLENTGDLYTPPDDGPVQIYKWRNNWEKKETSSR